MTPARPRAAPSTSSRTLRRWWWWRRWRSTWNQSRAGRTVRWRLQLHPSSEIETVNETRPFAPQLVWPSTSAATWTSRWAGARAGGSWGKPATWLWSTTGLRPWLSSWSFSAAAPWWGCVCWQNGRVHAHTSERAFNMLGSRLILKWNTHLTLPRPKKLSGWRLNIDGSLKVNVLQSLWCVAAGT